MEKIVKDRLNTIKSRLASLKAPKMDKIVSKEQIFVLERVEKELEWCLLEFNRKEK